MFFRFIGGGGIPYAIQNVLPILFNMSVKNYVIATFVGSIPSMFVTVSLGSGIENVIKNNNKNRSCYRKFSNIYTFSEISQSYCI